jgi:hypothetical protein
LSELRATGGDPLGTLRVVAKYRSLLDEVSRRAVLIARQTGRSWDDIAVAVGTSRQAAWQRYRSLAPPDDAVLRVLARYPNRRRRHLALRDAIAEDYGVVVSERVARELSAQLASFRPGPFDTIDLPGRDPVTGARTTKKASAASLVRYMLAVPPERPRPTDGAPGDATHPTPNVAADDH